MVVVVVVVDKAVEHEEDDEEDEEDEDNRLRPKLDTDRIFDHDTPRVHTLPSFLGRLIAQEFFSSSSSSRLRACFCRMLPSKGVGVEVEASDVTNMLSMINSNELPRIYKYPGEMNIVSIFLPSVPRKKNGSLSKYCDSPEEEKGKKKEIKGEKV